MPDINGNILLGHGSGGEMMQNLIQEVFLPLFGQPFPGGMADSAILPVTSSLPVFTTDSYVVDPIIFPGGNIGSIAVCGTINDLAVTGAKPKYISAGFIIEEGLPMAILHDIVSSMAHEARKSGVKIITGDTKVVEKGKADKIFINTTGIGYLDEKHFHIHRGNKAGPGDVLIINGFTGDHSIAVLSAREAFDFATPVISDCASLDGLISSLLRETDGVYWMRDITRGGLSTAVCDLVKDKDFGARVMEIDIPVSEAVIAACELLGYDPLYLGNEGKVLMAVDGKQADTILGHLKKHPLGADAAIIGELTSINPGEAVLNTRIGGSRLLHPLPGEQLPRIC